MKAGKIPGMVICTIAVASILFSSCDRHMYAPAYGGGDGDFGSYRGSVFKTKETRSVTGWDYGSSSDGGYEKTTRMEDGKLPDGVTVKEHTASSEVKSKAGLLTATEINDFSKWNLWNDFVKSELQAHQSKWKINPYARYTVQLENESGKPLQGANVSLVNAKNEILWQAVSDNTGKAQLWPALTADKKDSIPASIIINYGDITATINNPVEFEKGINHKKINTSCSVSNVADIAFVVDATGSMGDEIEYLKEELNDIITKVKNRHEKITVNTAAVFYRDKSDAYLTIHSDFSSDHNVTTAFIKKQSAGGGGDFPEAVDAGLDVAVNTLKWNEPARSKMVFIFLDAPPHSEKANEMKKIIFTAAKKGIKIIPVFSSGSDKSNQFIMRSAALATNGTSIFITNHSGIGGHHEEPVIDSYSVELLNDVLQRVIEQNIYMRDCNDNQTSSPEVAPDTLMVSNNYEMMNVALDSLLSKVTNDSTLLATLLPYTNANTVEELEKNKPVRDLDTAKLFTDLSLEVSWLKIYPNPTSGTIKAEWNAKTDFIYLSDMSGKILQRFSVNEQTWIQADLSSYPSGIYFIQYMEKEKWISAKVVLNK
ncbi:MAG: T9SS type A sorting domain-containing protein [Bacteroidota bacterium]